jgi:hypothetical protein
MLLEPVCQRKLKRQIFASSNSQRIVDYTLELSFSSIGAIKTHICPGTLISFRVCINGIMARPLVVRLPCIIGALKQYITRAIIRDNKDHVALPIRCRGSIWDRRQSTEINTAEPIIRNDQARCCSPLTLMQILTPRFRRRLCRCLQRTNGLHQPCT